MPVGFKLDRSALTRDGRHALWKDLHVLRIQPLATVASAAGGAVRGREQGELLGGAADMFLKIRRRGFSGARSGIISAPASFAFTSRRWNSLSACVIVRC